MAFVTYVWKQRTDKKTHKVTYALQLRVTDVDMPAAPNTLLADTYAAPLTAYQGVEIFKDN